MKIEKAPSRSRQQRGPGLKSKIRQQSTYMSVSERAYRKALIDDWCAKNDVQCQPSRIEPLPENEGYGIWGDFR